MCARKIHVHKLLFSSSQCLLRLGSLLRTQKDGGNIIFPPLPTYTWAQEADSSACGQGHAASEAGKLDSTSRGRAWPREWPPRCPTVEAEAVCSQARNGEEGPPHFLLLQISANPSPWLLWKGQQGARQTQQRNLSLSHAEDSRVLLGSQ